MAQARPTTRSLKPKAEEDTPGTTQARPSTLSLKRKDFLAPVAPAPARGLTLPLSLDPDPQLESFNVEDEFDALARAQTLVDRAIAGRPDALRAAFMRSKLMFVGRGRAGKTSTVNALRGRPFLPDEPSTIGIAKLDTVESRSWQDADGSSELGRAFTLELMRPPPTGSGSTTGTRSTERVAAIQQHLQGLSTRGTAETDPHDLPVTPPTKRTRLSSASPASSADAELNVIREQARQKALRTTHDGGRNVRFTIYDMVGQTLLYDLLHMHLSRHAVYVICFSMPDLLKNTQDCLTYIKFWLSSIALTALGAPVFLVGTRKDEVPSRADHEAIHAILDTLYEQKTFKHIVRDGELLFFPLDNTAAATDRTVTHLRASIEFAAASQQYTRLELPSNWLAFIDAVKFYCDKHQAQRVDLTTVKHIAASFKVSADELDICLRLFHEYGVLLRFDETVIIDPQWLVASLACAIRDYSLHTHSQQRALLEHPDQFAELREYAILRSDLIPILWPEADFPQQERDMLLRLLICLHMLIPRRPLKDEQEGEGEEISYIVPALLSPDLSGVRPRAALCDGLSDAMGPTHLYSGPRVGEGAEGAECYFVFTLNPKLPKDGTLKVATLERASFLPHGLFSRALCELVRHHQYSQRAPPALSLTEVRLMFGPSAALVEVFTHISAIRVSCEPHSALHVVPTVKRVLDNVRETFFPGAHMLVLLPLSKSRMVPLDTVVKAADAGETIVHLEGRVVDLADARFRPFLPVRGLQDDYDVFLSYRWDANSDFVAILADTLRAQRCKRTGRQLAVFHGKYALAKGRPISLDFQCTALRRTRVAVPVVSLQALLRLVNQPASKVQDNMLLEWMLMLRLQQEGFLPRLLPVVLGSGWANQTRTLPAGAALSAVPVPPVPAIYSISELLAWVAENLPDLPCLHTASMLERVCSDLGIKSSAAAAASMAPGGAPPSIRRTVLDILNASAIQFCDADDIRLWNQEISVTVAASVSRAVSPAAVSASAAPVPVGVVTGGNVIGGSADPFAGATAGSLPASASAAVVPTAPANAVAVVPTAPPNAAALDGSKAPISSTGRHAAWAAIERLGADIRVVVEQVHYHATLAGQQSSADRDMIEAADRRVRVQALVSGLGLTAASIDALVQANMVERDRLCAATEGQLCSAGVATGDAMALKTHFPTASAESQARFESVLKARNVNLSPGTIDTLLKEDLTTVDVLSELTDGVLAGLQVSLGDRIRILKGFKP
eukprot:m.4850 g.4850  ORF g.4850 m.4850 type:complete len:1245 (+) comp1947_c0_seq2:86-3820(+)